MTNRSTGCVAVVIANNQKETLERQLASLRELSAHDLAVRNANIEDLAKHPGPRPRLLAIAFGGVLVSAWLHGGSATARTANVKPNRRTLVDTVDVSGISAFHSRYPVHGFGH